MNAFAKLKQILAEALTISLVTASFPGGATAQMGPETLASLAPASSIASLVKTGGPSRAIPQVLLIEDLHFNYSVQRNIGRLLTHLSSKNVLGEKVAVEGAVGDIDNSPLSEVKDLKVRGELADFLMRNGELTGSQQFSAMTGRPLALFGVEDEAFFQANREIFRASHEDRAFAVRQVSALRNRLTPMLRNCSKPARIALKAQSAFERGDLSLDRYLSIISKRASAIHLALPPAAQQYVQARGRERDDLSMQPGFFETLSVFGTQVAAAAARNDKERSIIFLVSEFTLAEKVLSQHATLEEVRAFSPRIERLGAALKEILPASGDLDATIRSIKDASKASVDFYVAALMRNDPLLENTLKLASANGAGKATALVIGGFHTQFLTKELEKRGISYAVFTPAVDTHTPADDRLYEKRFMGQRMTASEVVNWFADAKGSRGSPAAFGGAGLIPKLQGLPWFPSLRKAAEANRSLYGRHSAGVRFLEDLRAKGISDISFSDSISFPLRTIDDLKKIPLDHPAIPKAEHLKAALYVLMESQIKMPIDSIEFTNAGSAEWNQGTQSDTMKPFEQASLIEMQETSKDSGRYHLLVHAAAIANTDIFEKSPYRAYLNLFLHETAEYRPFGVSHAELEKLGLDFRLSPDTTVSQLLRRYAPHIPDFDRDVLYRHDRRGLIEFYDLALPYLDRERATRPDLTLGTLTSGDINKITSYENRTGRKAGQDYRPGRPSDLLTLPDMEAISAEDQEAAVRAELEGRVIKQFLAGGDMSRMKKSLNAGGFVIPNKEFEAMWLLQLGRIVNADRKPDGIRWGARQAIRLNQSRRKLARDHRSLGISEERALANEHIVVHIKDSTKDDVIDEWVEHDFYGFNPNHVYFLPSRMYWNWRFDSELGLWIPDPASQSVLGNGTGQELLVFRDTAIQVDREGRRRNVDTSVLSAIASHFKRSEALMIRPFRVNDLKNLDPGIIDIRRTAYSQMKIKQGFALGFESVQNPDLIEEFGGEVKIQKGGLFQVFDHLKQSAMMEAITLRDPESLEQKAVAEAEAKARGDLPFVNRMGGAASSIPELAQDLEQGLPAQFEGKWRDDKKDPVKNAAETPDWIAPQFVAGDSSFPERGQKAFFYYEPGVFLEDLKSTAWSQMREAEKKLRASEGDSKFLALAALYGWFVAPERPINLQLVEMELDAIARNSGTPEMSAKVEIARARLRESRKTPVQDEAPLNAKQTHAFAAVVSVVALALALIFQPVAAFAAAPWVLSAFAQEVAVITGAASARDASLLYSSKPVATFDFTTQTESGRRGFGSIGAHAHELARAVTQSRGAVMPRLIAPIMLALAIIDRFMSLVFDTLKAILDWLRNEPPASEMGDVVAAKSSTLSKIFSDPLAAGIPEASSVWSRIQLGLKAVYKNSEARQSAAELAARRAIAFSA